VKGLFKLFALSVFAVLALAVPAMAQDGGGTSYAIPGALGAGLCCIGGGLGIGKLAAAGLESIARQPEVTGPVQTYMIITAALIEGFVFFALYICMSQNPYCG